MGRSGNQISSYGKFGVRIKAVAAVCEGGCGDLAPAPKKLIILCESPLAYGIKACYTVLSSQYFSVFTEFFRNIYHPVARPALHLCRRTEHKKGGKYPGLGVRQRGDLSQGIVGFAPAV